MKSLIMMIVRVRVLHISYLIYEFLKLLISFVELFSNIFEPFALVPKSNNEGKYRQKENW